MKRLTALSAALAATLASGCAVPDVRRSGFLAEIKPGMLEKCRAVCAAPPREAVDAMKAAGLRNCTYYVKKIGEDRALLFGYAEHTGRAVAPGGRELDACLVGTPAWTELEQIFYTDGASDVAPTPGKYARIGMITGLKPEKEAEYRTLHSTTWPGVLKGIKDGNLRNFSIFLAESGEKLYLLGYLEYVGADGAADDAKAQALPVNKRWWKLTDAYQDPLPAAAAKKKMWDGMEEVFHMD